MTIKYCRSTTLLCFPTPILIPDPFSILFLFSSASLLCRLVNRILDDLLGWLHHSGMQLNFFKSTPGVDFILSILDYKRHEKKWYWPEVLEILILCVSCCLRIPRSGERRLLLSSRKNHNANLHNAHKILFGEIVAHTPADILSFPQTTKFFFVVSKEHASRGEVRCLKGLAQGHPAHN